MSTPGERLFRAWANWARARGRNPCTADCRVMEGGDPCSVCATDPINVDWVDQSSHEQCRPVPRSAENRAIAWGTEPSYSAEDRIVARYILEGKTDADIVRLTKINHMQVSRIRRRFTS